MARESRWDRSSFEAAKATKTPEGYLRADAYLTRVGIFVYNLPDGTVRRELRPPEEVFKKDSLDSLKQLPLTNKHPVEGFVTAKTAKRHQTGSVGDTNVTDGDYIQASLMMTDEALVSSVERRDMGEVSCGYKCDVEPQSGTWRGQQYDAVQKNIQYNHVAIVPRGRAGREVRLHIDSEAGEMQLEEPSEAELAKQKADAMTLEEAMKQLKDATDRASKTDEALAKLRSDHEALSGKFTAQQAAYEDLKTKHADAAGAQPKAIAARVALERQAIAILGDKVDLSTKTDAEVKAEVVKHVQPTVKLDGKDESFIGGMYEFALTVHADKQKDLTARKQSLHAVHDKTKRADGEQKSDAEKAREKMIEDSRNAWKKTGA